MFVSLSVLLFLDLFEYFTVRRERGELFPPKIGWRLFYFAIGACLLFFAIEYFTAGGAAQHDGSSAWIVLLIFVLWITRPATLEASDSGLASYGWFGLRKSFIAWTDVASVASEWENDRGNDRFALFVRSISVTVGSREGKRLRLSYMHGGLSRFMQALQKHVPANAFGPGLRDWKP